MARHAEVTAEDIIRAGIEIEKSGRLVNPGSIRNKLGSGGFPRIKNVWEEHKKQVGIIEIDEPAIELPTEIADNLEALSKQMQAQLTKITKSSYDVAMHLAEKRVASTISDYKEKITELEQFETDANETVQQCEKEHDELYIENENIRIRIESISIDNATLTAQLNAAKETINRLEIKEKKLDELQQLYSKLLGKYELLESQLHIQA